MLNGEGNEGGNKISKSNYPNCNKFARATHFFCTFICGCFARRLLVFLFAFIFSLPLIFTLLAARFSHFLTTAMKFSCFSPNEIRLVCF